MSGGNVGEAALGQRDGVRERGIVLRVAGWAMLPAFLAAFWYSGSWSIPFAWAVVVERGAYALPIFLTVVFSLKSAARSERMEGRFWVFLTVSNLSLLVCEIALIYYLIAVDPSGPTRVTVLWMSLHAVAAVSLLGCLASMTRLALAAPAVRVRYTMDVIAVAVIIYVPMLVLYARPVMLPSAANPSDALVGAVYPTVAVLMCAGVILNVAGLKVVSWRPWEKLVVLSICVYFLGVFLWPSWYATASDSASQNSARGVVDLVQLSGHYVLMMGTIYRLTARDAWYMRPLPPLTLVRRRWLSAGLPVAAIMVVAALFGAGWDARSDGPWGGYYLTLAALLTGAVLTRSAMISLEHGSLFKDSISDPLTGVYNHRFFHARLGQEVMASRRLGEPLSVVVLDIDNFGELNAARGHSGGDHILVCISERIRSMFGTQDIVARIGGDKFGLILVGKDGREASVATQRLLDYVEIEGGPDGCPVTLSAGIAAMPEHADDPERLLHLAECSWMWAKKHGKARYVLFEEGRVPDLDAKQLVAMAARQSRATSVRALAAAVDARDPATQFHSRRVAALVRRVCEECDVDSEQMHLLELAALMHDVGKIGIPDAVLQKERPLTEFEWATIREHPVMGQKVLSATDLDEVLPWVRGHHERWDGTGYPDRLRGEQIPREARILALCDAYEAMTSDRPYRKALSKRAALQEIDMNMGTQFDPDLAEMFIRVISAEDEAETYGMPIDVGLPS